MVVLPPAASVCNLRGVWRIDGVGPIFVFIDGWSEYLLPRILAPAAQIEVLSVYLERVSQKDSITYDFNLFKAVGLYYTLPVIILFIIFQNRLMNIFSGGTKG